MAKKALRKKPAKSARYDIENRHYFNVDTDKALMARFKQRAEQEGHSMVWVLRNFIQMYADGS